MRFFGLNLPDTTILSMALPKIFGLGRVSSINICRELGISSTYIIGNLTDTQLNNIRKWIESNVKTELELKKYLDSNISSLVSINCYRGVRHRMGLPVRGQRTHSNARTQRKRRMFSINRSN